MASANTRASKSNPNASSTQAPSPAPNPASPPPNAALAAYVAQAMAQVDAAESALAVDPPALTPSQKRRAAKLRSGGDKAVGQIAALAKQYGVESSVLQADAMSLALADAQTLAPLMARVQAFQKHLGDLLFLWQSAAWGDAMQFYALLQRRALVDGSLLENLAPVAAFFAKRHASTKAAGQPPKRTAKANAKAVNRLRKAAPELLANDGKPAAAAPASPPMIGGNGAGGVAHS
jgi:hypothetical protein